MLFVTTGEPSKIFIDPDTDDMFYRYKTRQLKIQRVTNFTILVNLDDMALDLHVLPGVILKFICYRIGTGGKYDKKKGYWCIQKSSVTEKELDEIVRDFIANMIMCKNCKLPELTYVGAKNKKCVKINCSSCGWRGFEKDLMIDDKLKKALKTFY